MKMRKTILLLLVGIFALFLTVSCAYAKEAKVPINASASSTYQNSSFYGPNQAIDGDEATCWIGGQKAAPWWIVFDAGEVRQIDKINIKWRHSHFNSVKGDVNVDGRVNILDLIAVRSNLNRSTLPSGASFAEYAIYAPQDYDIQISSDGTNWETVLSDLDETDISHQLITINRQARYIRLYINQAVAFPALKEFAAYTAELSVPHLMRFQAKLGDAQGAPIDGEFTIKFRLYNTETAGTPLWEEVQDGVIIENALVDVELGNANALDLPFDEQYWLALEIESDGEMLPRFKLTSVPYAFVSEE